MMPLLTQVGVSLQVLIFCLVDLLVLTASGCNFQYVLVIMGSGWASTHCCPLVLDMSSVIQEARMVFTLKFERP